MQIQGNFVRRISRLDPEVEIGQQQKEIVAVRSKPKRNKIEAEDGPSQTTKQFGAGEEVSASYGREKRTTSAKTKAEGRQTKRHCPLILLGASSLNQNLLD